MLARHQQRKKRLLQAHDAVAVQGATLEDVYENSRVKFSLSLPLIGSFLSRDVHVSLPCWLDFQHLLFYHQKKSPLEYCIIEIFSCLNGGIRISTFLCVMYVLNLFGWINLVFSNQEVKPPNCHVLQTSDLSVCVQWLGKVSNQCLFKR